MSVCCYEVSSEISTQPVPLYPDLAGKIAVVTGGSKGIGAATCRVLSANSVNVAVVARSQDGIDSVVRDIQVSGGRAFGFTADCTRWSDLERLRGMVETELGTPDILVAFAGGFSAFTPVHEISEREWHEVLDANLTATFLTVKAFLPKMIEHRRGTIVTMASNAGRFLDMQLTASYAAAKAGIVMFTRHVALETGKHGIRVNCVAPATTRSDRVDRIMSAERQQHVAEMSPLGRMGLPDDTALATLFLVSNSASWITGITVDIAGGRIML